MEKKMKKTTMLGICAMFLLCIALIVSAKKDPFVTEDHTFITAIKEKKENNNNNPNVVIEESQNIGGEVQVKVDRTIFNDSVVHFELLQTTVTWDVVDNQYICTESFLSTHAPTTADCLFYEPDFVDVGGGEFVNNVNISIVDVNVAGDNQGAVVNFLFHP